MNRLLLRPVARAIRVQRSAVCTASASRSLIASQCRKFSSTSPANKRKTPKNMPTADFFDEIPAEVVEKASEVQLGATTPKPEPTDASIPTAKIESKPPSKPSSKGESSSSISQLSFNPEHYFSSWSSPHVHEILASQEMSLFDYIATAIQTPTSFEVIASLETQSKLEFDKRWTLYEAEHGQGEVVNNMKSLLPVLDFFLHRGLQIRPPSQDLVHLLNPIDNSGEFDLDGVFVSKIDPATVEQAYAVAKEGDWQAPKFKLKHFPTQFNDYPDLMTPDALLDPRDVTEFPPSKDSPFHNRVIVRNHRSVFHNYAEGVSEDLLEDDELPENEGQDTDEMLKALPVPTKYYMNLHQSILMRRSVVQQTGKGKIRRVAFMVLVGDGNGLVGYGEGKHSNGSVALKAARLAAVNNMDWVERFEKRTIWTEMSTKLGATQIILRPRPVGFGLRCNPFLHRILRAAGLKDISAKVWGSRNKLNVIKAAFRMLHAGHAPTSMGDGIGGKGKKLSKGGGLKSKSDVERARGRKLINLRL
ncbi:unnamed protein product [Cyclocybe aegerita]|uniref:S5 DRBM domain-containing protein n=1 Tax=Cyclocybe aegerita TaxID=1973307 RepID=A0A8S0VUC3_CYCAE|nr:unnamed protein product [Cyclocybe aegerita]